MTVHLNPRDMRSLRNRKNSSYIASHHSARTTPSPQLKLRWSPLPTPSQSQLTFNFISRSSSSLFRCLSSSFSRSSSIFRCSARADILKCDSKDDALGPNTHAGELSRLQPSAFKRGLGKTVAADSWENRGQSLQPFSWIGTRWEKVQDRTCVYGRIIVSMTTAAQSPIWLKI